MLIYENTYSIAPKINFNKEEILICVGHEQ